jgi:hypothetical protein
VLTLHISSVTSTRRAIAQNGLPPWAVYGVIALMTCLLGACTTAAPGANSRVNSKDDVHAEARIGRILASVTDLAMKGLLLSTMPFGRVGHSQDEPRQST